ncbi:hypothetical protein [Persicobacter sp. CCB-QB2]|uniref:hypothetical protein n=1 Tax=Persicobacter sp. CCB-QB2 TaxID=1561025 RepID=UPI0006A9F8F6|nr:hypothetical protein [Persicobacter sp. CCB-QB2]
MIRSVFSFLLLTLLFISCHIDEQSPLNSKGEMSLTMKLDLHENGRQAAVAMVEENGSIVYEIAPCLNGDCSSIGDNVKYTVDAYIYSDGSIASEKLLLPVGDYVINSCALINSQGDFIGYVPIEGKDVPDDYVGDPCPIQFTISANSIVPVDIYFVLTSTAGGSLTDIGYEHIDGVLGSYNKLYLEIARMIPVNGDKSDQYINKAYAGSFSIAHSGNILISDYTVTNGLAVILLPDDYLGEDLDITVEYVPVAKTSEDDTFVYKKDSDPNSDAVGALISSQTVSVGGNYETSYQFTDFQPEDWFMTLINPYLIIVVPPEDCPDLWMDKTDYTRGDLVSVRQRLYSDDYNQWESYSEVTFTWICLESHKSKGSDIHPDNNTSLSRDNYVKLLTENNANRPNINYDNNTRHVVYHYDKWLLLGICEGAWPNKLQLWTSGSYFAQDQLVQYTSNGSRNVYQSILELTGNYTNLKPDETPLWNYIGTY